MTLLISLLSAALAVALFIPGVVATLREAFPEIPPEFLERPLVI